MVSLNEWPLILEKTLQAYAELPYALGDAAIYVVVSRDNHHFFLMHEGWQGAQRIHGMVVHAEIREDKI